MQNVAFVVLPEQGISIVTNTRFETATEVWDSLPSMKKVKKYKNSELYSYWFKENEEI